MMQVIGAGFGRTGTVSLKLALEQLLAGPCYHMTEQMNRPRDAASWWAGVRGESVDWPRFLEGWVATVDWPGCAVWSELAAAFPEAKVLLSTRDPDSWWESANRTILPAARALEPDSLFRSYLLAVFHKTGVDLDDRDASIKAFIRHNKQVRAAFSPDRLIEWSSGDGWEPLCTALNVPEPENPYPHANKAGGFEEFLNRARVGDVARNAEPPPYND